MDQEQLIKHLKANDFKLLKCLEADGHQIYIAQHYLDQGFSIDITNPLDRVHESDGTTKGSIFMEAHTKSARYLKGVYNLEFLWHIALILDAKVENKFGRGSQARELVLAIEREVENG